MKHNIKVLAALIMGVAMLLGSCEERIGGEGNISFTADVASFKGYGVGAKSAPIGDPLNGEDTYVPLFQDTYGTNGFTVSAYKGITARFTNATSKYSGGKWVLNPSAKWYSGETLDFYAMAPAAPRGITNTSVDASGKKMSFTYKIPTNKGSGQPDIMVGYYSGVGVQGTEAGERVAPLTFYHPLTAVRFKAGDIAGSVIREVAITGLYDEGTCTVDMASLGTAGAGAVNWTLNTTSAPAAVSGFPFEPSITAVAGNYLSGPECAVMIIPQVLTDAAFLSVGVDNPNADDDPDTPDDVINFKVSLKTIELKAGQILDITINYKGIDVTFDERTMIVPWDPQPEIPYNDFELVPTMAYLEAGPAFNSAIRSLGTIRKIVFDRGGSVDEEGSIQIQAPNPDGLPIYAKYDAVTGTVRITTHANAIQAHKNCSEMFKDMTDLTEIVWGMFFDTSETENMSKMFMGCDHLLDINLIDVVNTVNVLNFSHMFDGCSAATRIILGNDFHTKKATDISYMFNDCTSITSISLGQYFDTRNVKTMAYMFCNCSGLSALDVGELFYTYQVEDFSYMFYNISVRNLHFNSRFYIKSNPRPVATNMMYNTFGVSPVSVFVTSNTWTWVTNSSNTGYNYTGRFTGSHTSLPAIIYPND